MTQQGWMLQSSYADLRRYVLNHTNLATLAHLGPRAFEEISGEVVKAVLFTVSSNDAKADSVFKSFRLVNAESPSTKQEALISGTAERDSSVVFTRTQSLFMELPNSPLVYWLNQEVLNAIQHGKRLKSIAGVKQGIATADNERFTRCFWEVQDLGVVISGNAVEGRWFELQRVEHIRNGLALNGLLWTGKTRARD